MQQATNDTQVNNNNSNRHNTNTKRKNKAKCSARDNNSTSPSNQPLNERGNNYCILPADVTKRNCLRQEVKRDDGQCLKVEHTQQHFTLFLR